jgi:hypothetical protein
LFGIGHLQTAAMISLLGMGPAIDFARHRPGQPWQTFLRFAGVGLMVNLLSLAARWGMALFQADDLHPLNMRQWGTAAIVSFAACGLLAGLLSAAICYRNPSITGTTK